MQPQTLLRLTLSVGITLTTALVCYGSTGPRLLSDPTQIDVRSYPECQALTLHFYKIKAVTAARGGQIGRRASVAASANC